jgi:hypothetical protein
LIESIRRNRPATSSTPWRKGRVTCRVICHAEAPSTRAASTISCGIICSAAKVISMVKGAHCQVSATMIAVSAQSGSVMSDGTVTPSSDTPQCSGLMSGV